MKNIMKLRVHIAPVGFEIDRIIVPATNMRADKIWLIGHNNLSQDKARPFLEKVRKTLEKKNIEVKEVTADRYRLFDIVRTIKEIISEEKNNDIYLNVASGSKIHAVGMMMATMIFDDRSNLHPFYAQAKEYHYTKISEPHTTGIEAIHDLPTYRIHTPSKKHLDALKILVDNDGKMKKKEMAEIAEEQKIIIINAEPSNHSQARFASLDKNIISPLENDWGYITTEKVGRNRWIHLTDEGRWASEFLI
ncbi:MAG: hypothetical protein HOF89_05240 [Candidatus Nitrosopelagicus sp.]|jgi:hypothetical protein|nr:hypothetical protein [Candidatus Nitrosopelagicus sp.]MBT3761971.1 hypothetical protein [Candidatus Nitrosopelagicus sp.]MBT4328084.1 hypothetical protein [Candidatus Nitrosopelagicus sp.]MBT6646293.1 hypothetical protein [Nitrososphaerota archaeon]MBT7252163.1 hypothetical protein [Candidatus Nitrosopelagicus sp.]